MQARHGVRSALAELYPGWDTSLMKYEIWWYNDGSGDPKKVLLEPEGAITAIGCMTSDQPGTLCS